MHTHTYVHLCSHVLVRENMYKFEAGGYGRCRYMYAGYMYAGYGRCRWHKGHTYISMNVYTYMDKYFFVCEYVHTHTPIGQEHKGAVDCNKGQFGRVL